MSKKSNRLQALFKSSYSSWLISSSSKQSSISALSSAKDGLELFFKKLACKGSEPKIRYLLKLFSRKKLESISIISELGITLFLELSKKVSPSNGFACILIGEKSKKTNKTIDNLI